MRTGSAVESDREGSRPSARGLLESATQSLVAQAFGARLRRRADTAGLGPNLGFVSQRLSELDLDGATPSHPPDPESFDPPLSGEVFDSQPSPELQLANAWAAALQRAFAPTEEALRLRQPGFVQTTYGFAWVQGRVRLSVIVYMKPLAAFRTRLTGELFPADGGFPVIVRPWLPQQHSAQSGNGEGSCWVRMPSADGEVMGILTAEHALQPRGALPGDAVRAAVSRPDPGGRLAVASPRMDAAVVDVGPGQWLGGDQVTASSVVGFKPVRLLGTSTVDADVVEHSGLVGGSIPANPGREPRASVQLILNRHLDAGDSGCLGLDLELARFGDPPPYLLYLGAQHFGFGGVGGYALMLEQPRQTWNLHFYPR